MQEITLKDSNITVKVRKVSPLLFLEIRKQFPPPKPPLNKVTDLNGKDAWEENKAHPDYLQALSDYEDSLNTKVQDLMFRRGVEVEVNSEAVNELKAFWKETFDKELEGNDRDIYIRYVVIQSTDDFNQLYEAIMEKSQPTAEDINAAKQGFKS